MGELIDPKLTLDRNLFNCPFCNGTASLSSGYMAYTIVGYYVECIDCGSSSHMNPDENETIKLWNTRHNPNLDKCIDYLNSLSAYEDCEYPFHAFDNSTDKKISAFPSEILKELKNE